MKLAVRSLQAQYRDIRKLWVVNRRARGSRAQRFSVASGPRQVRAGRRATSHLVRIPFCRRGRHGRLIPSKPSDGTTGRSAAGGSTPGGASAWERGCQQQRRRAEFCPQTATQARQRSCPAPAIVATWPASSVLSDRCLLSDKYSLSDSIESLGRFPPRPTDSGLECQPLRAARRGGG